MKCSEGLFLQGLQNSLFHLLGSFHPLLSLGCAGLPTATQPYLLKFLLRAWRQHSQNPRVIPRLRAATSQLT